MSGGGSGYGAPAAPQGYLGAGTGYVAPQMTGNYANDVGLFRAAGSPDSNKPWSSALAAEQQAWMKANPGQGDNPTGPGGANPWMGNAMPRYSFGGFGMYPGGSQNQGPGASTGQFGQTQPIHGGSSGAGAPNGPGVQPAGQPQVTSDPFPPNYSGSSGGQGAGMGAGGLLGNGFGSQSSAPTPAGFFTPQTGGPVAGPQTSGAPASNAFMQNPAYYGMSAAMNGPNRGAAMQQFQQQSLGDRQAYFQSLTNDRDKKDFLFNPVNKDLYNQQAGSMGSNWAPWLAQAQTASNGVS